MKKKIISFLLIAGIMAGVMGCGNDSAAVDEKNTDSKNTEEGLQTVRIGVMTGNIDHWLVEIGIEKGIFEKYGIQPEITEFAAGINTVDAIVTNQSDIGFLADYAAVNRLGNTQDNTDIRLIAKFVSSSINRLYVNPKEVTKLEDLAGKGLVTLPGTVWDYWNAKTFEKAGIPKDEQILVNVDSAQAALGVMTNGEGVAFWASGTNGKKLEEAGMEVLLDMNELGLQTDQYFVTTEKYIEENEEVVINYLLAIQEIQDWVLENKEEAAKIAEKNTGIPAEQFVTNLDALTLSVGLEQDTIDHLNSIKNWALESGTFDKNFEINDYVDTTPLQKGEL